MVAEESSELPPPGTNASEYIFKNSNRFSKLNYSLLSKKNGFFSPVLTTITDGKFLIPYLLTRLVSVFLTSPKFNFFSKATLSPLYIIEMPLGLSVKSRTLGTLGF